MDDEKVFKALADANRRKLLDLLFQRDGQTVGELAAHLAEEMTRFGCMKHLQVLEDAGLLSTRKVGREKFHYLNPVPIQSVYDRWVTKYARPWARSLTDFKAVMEGNAMADKPDHIFHVYIRTTPERLWQALTDGEFTRQYYFNTEVRSTWKPGDPYSYHYPETDKVMLGGDVIEADPPRRLVTTFRPLWIDEAAQAPASTVIFEIERLGETCKLTLTHIDLDPASAPAKGIVEGWAQILSGLKTLLETGQPLVIDPAT
jgi:uncharacterized protein YndB with AHSA1/START domain/DNA-binding transcriptional ArsR family regulator